MDVFEILASASAKGTEKTTVEASNKMLERAESSAADAADIIGDSEKLARFIVAKATNRALNVLVKAETERQTKEAQERLASSK